MSKKVNYDDLSNLSFNELLELFENCCINMYRTHGEIWESWKESRFKVRQVLIDRYNFR